MGTDALDKAREGDQETFEVAQPTTAKEFDMDFLDGQRQLNARQTEMVGWGICVRAATIPR